MVFIKFKLIYLIIIIFLLFKSIASGDSDRQQQNVKMVERKFGDRILPRNKQQIEDRNFNLINNNNNSSSNSVSNNHNNNNNSYSEYNVFNYNSVLGSISANPTTSVDILVTNSDNSSDKLLKNYSASSISSNSVRKPKSRNLSEPINSDQARYSNIQAHRLEMSTEFFVVPSTSSSLSMLTAPPSSSTMKKPLVAAPSRSTTISPGGMILAAKTTESPYNDDNNDNITINDGTTKNGGGGLRKEPWVVPILVLASITMIMMAGFEVFVLFKAWRTSPSRRHLFLGQMLLLGLFSCAGLGAIITITPTLLSCAIIRFGAGVAFALVFASLLVKCVFLISLNSGVYLPAPYQALLLLFAVLIQVAVGTQWLITSPPSIDNVSISFGDTTNLVSSKYSLVFTSSDVSILNQTNKIQLCKTQFSEFLLSLIYVIFLIGFVTILAIKSRRIRDNYREATYIGLSIGGIIPIWLGWTLCGLVIAERHRDACLAFGLVASSATVFLVMFMPKGRQLAAMGKEGFYVEDREEHFSSLSRAGSGYSPSFFHFKPIKYGVMGTAQTNNTNILLNGGCDPTTTMQTQNIKSNQGVATLGGDHVTLIAVPPSYTRMYHYFPAHLTQPICYYSTQQSTWYPGLFIRPDDTNVYTTLEPTMSSNPNVYFQRGIHPGMMY